ncbi:hypothetical protein [Deinococcus sp. S9]|uniref:hypothetical protein n=1 Tax=Deinococcus sp. S9 TaxID=2545754 RepID=UPI001054F250|nr:hypothetical protein [Deinococcus sp. S9]TDE85056.1 hypothetical protein E0686_13925 [Deinococcus sp. S9]
MGFWLLSAVLLLLTAALLVRFTRALSPTPEAHQLARGLGLAGRRSVFLVIGCGNALLLTAPGQFPVPQASWSAAALLLLGVLGACGWSAWRQQDR